MNPIQLSTPDGCERELTRCTNGMAFLDHAFYLAVAARDEAEQSWEEWEAKATADIAPPKGITATELRGRITSWCAEHPEALAAKGAFRKATSNLKKLERYYRSAEQRSSNAQSALKRHLGGAALGGRE